VYYYAAFNAPCVGHGDASARLTDEARGIMFSGCLSVCAFVGACSGGGFLRSTRCGLLFSRKLFS